MTGAPHDDRTEEVSTWDSTPRESAGPTWSVALTVLLHPDPEMIGARALLGTCEAPVAITRGAPAFRLAGRSARRSLTSPRVSRSPLWVHAEGGALHVRPGTHRRPPRLDGAELRSTQVLPVEDLQEGGATIELGGCVLLWLHRVRGPAAHVSWEGLVGISPPMLRLRDQISRLGHTTEPLLVRGESGAGKELVARAVHARSTRRRGPFVGVNMSAIPVATAASELFGSGRGSFTGAVRDRQGWFAQAAGGTLLLDEIGETPVELQAQLLRVLDSGIIQPVGQPQRRVDVRVIAATDADLEAQIARGEFRPALLFRLQSAELRVPPLRDRRQDVPLLLHRFLQEHLQQLGSDRLQAPRDSERPWLRSGLVVRLMDCAFPGNVRQLRSVALAIATSSHDRSAASLPDHLWEGLGRRDAVTEQRASGSARLGAELARAALARNDWVVSRAARDLGVAKNTLTTVIRESPGLRLAADLGADEVQHALATHHHDTAAAAVALEVSHHGLRLRMRALDAGGD